MRAGTRLAFLAASSLAFATCSGGSANSPSVDGTWGTPQPVSRSVSIATYPQAAIVSGSAAIVVWEQWGDGIGFNQNDAGTGWGTAAIVPDSVGGTNPRIATDRNGHLIAVWQRLEGSAHVIRANRYVAGQGWGAASRVSPDNTVDSQSPEIVSDRNGNAVVVWQQGNVIGANQYDAVNGWGTASVISENAVGAYSAQVAFDNNGNALAVWFQNEGTFQTVRSRRYTVTGGWDALSITLDNSSTSVDWPQIAMNDRGDAVAAWQKAETDNVGFWMNVWAKRYAPGTGWGAAALVSDNTGYAIAPQVAIDRGGNAVAIWSLYSGTNYVARANRYSESQGWGAGVIVGPGDAGDALPSHVATDSDGNAIAVWTQVLPGPWHVWANHYVKNRGWGAAWVLDNNDIYRAGSPRLAIDDIGNAVAVWHQIPNSGAGYTIWARRFERR